MVVRFKTVITRQYKTAGIRPAHNKMNKQVEYKAGCGKFYSLLMGREFQPRQYAILFFFDNTVRGDTKSGLVLVDKLNMDPYDAPKQHAPSSGLHYIFYVDGEQAK